MGPASTKSSPSPAADTVNDALAVRQGELLATAHLKPEERIAFVQAVRSQIEARRASRAELPTVRLRECEPEERVQKAGR